MIDRDEPIQDPWARYELETEQRHALNERVYADAKQAFEDQRLSDSPFRRRVVLYVALSAIEAHIYGLRQDILGLVTLGMPGLSIGALATLREEDYTLDDTGTVTIRPRKLRIGAAIRFTWGLYAGMSGTTPVDFGGAGWRALQTLIRARHRVTHPRDLKELEVTDSEISVALDGLVWYLDMDTRLHEAMVARLRAQQARRAQQASREGRQVTEG